MEPATAHRQFEITLLQERAAGTFARVYLAESAGADGLARIVAVKVLKEQWSESSELLARTRDEARLLARLRHKNILRVEALAELQGQPAIVMEFVDGLDLKQLISKLAERGQRIPPRAAYSIAQQSASALDAAYARVPYGMAGALQVVHRDVKPSNIMVSCEGEVKVLDFGTARYTWEGRLAKTGALRFGSLKYMSPERRGGDRGDHTSDIYSLGLVLLEMLQGTMLPLLPLEPTEHDRTIAEAVTSLDDLGLPNEEWVDSLHQTLARMCAADPALRLDASQVVQLLRAFVDHATGRSLDSFAADEVSTLAQQLYGRGEDGALSGSRIFVALTPGADGADAGAGIQPVPSPAPPAPPADPGVAGPPDPSASLVARVPDPSTPRGATDPFAYEPPDSFEGTPAAGIDPRTEMPTERARAIHAHGASVTAPAVGHRPGTAQPIETYEPYEAGRTDPTLHQGPPPGRRGAPGSAPPHPGPATPRHPGRGVHGQSGLPPAPIRGAPPPMGQPATGAPARQARRPLPPPPTQAETTWVEGGQGEPARSGIGTIVIGIVVGLLAVGLGGAVVIGAAAVAWLLFFRPGPVEVQPSLVEAAQVAPPPAPGAVALSLAAGDDRIQWLRVEDATGSRVFSGDPGGEISLSPGTYELQAKAVGRGKVAAELELDRPLALSCAPADKGQVRCQGDRELLLSP